MDEETITAVRTAFDDIVDTTPEAPPFSELTQGRSSLVRASSQVGWRRGVLVAAGAAVVVLLVAVVTTVVISGNGAPDSGSEPTTTTVATTTSKPPPTTAVSEVLDVDLRVHLASIEASSELQHYGVTRLVDGDVDTAWNDDSRRGEGATLVLSFVQPVHLSELVFHNLRETRRWERDFRIRAIAYEADVFDSSGQVVVTRGGAEIPDGVEPHRVSIGLDVVQRLTIQVTGTYPAEFTEDGPPFEELALAEIELFGYPLDAIPSTVTTLPPTTTPTADSCSAADLAMPLDQAGLPPAVAETRQSLIELALQCDFAGLVDLIGQPANQGAVDEFWWMGTVSEEALRQRDADEDALADVVRILNVPYAVRQTDRDGANTELYVWPSLFWSSDLEADDVVAATAAALGMTTEELADSIDVFGGYAGFRVGIWEDGTWAFALAGD